MVPDLNVKVGPQYYRYDFGAIDLIPGLLDEHQAKKVLIVHGTISWDKAKKYLDELFESDFELFFEQYNGVCSYNEGNRLSKIIEEKEIDFVIGVGGGSLSDLVLYTSHLSNTQFGVVPTLASNCAPWTPLSVMYKDNGLAEGNSEHVKRQAAFFITDPELVIDSPVRYFIAGIADTLAKWYESDLILKQDYLKNESFLQMARFASKICKDQLLEHGTKAIKDMENGEATEEFIRVSEIIFGIAGLVGGLGDKYARNTAAHTAHDALSAHLPDLHTYFHGEKVAYGIFFQLSLEKNWDEIDKLIPLYKELNLPMSLTEMGEYPLSKKDRKEIIELMYNKNKIHELPFEITKETLSAAIDDLEKYIKTYKKGVKGVK